MAHVIWDWNGTLVDDLGVVVESVNASLQQLDAGPIGAAEYRTHYTRPVRVFYDRLLNRPITDVEWEVIDRAFHRAYDAALADIELAPGARGVIAGLYGAGHTQSILSMWWAQSLRPEVGRHHLDGFMIRVDGNRGLSGDTKEQLLRDHLQRLDLVDPDSAAMVGDSVDDARAAAAVGIRCVLYNGGSHHREQLEGCGFPVVDDLVAAARLAVSPAG